MVAGYTISFCFRCTYNYGGSTIDTDNWTIEQKPSCLSNLHPADSVKGDVTLPYDPSKTSRSILTLGYSSFFKTTDTTDCPINYCTILNTDLTPYSGTSDFMMAGNSGTYPFHLKAYQNIPLGYTVSVIIECKAHTDVIRSLTWTYTQSKIDCSNALTQATPLADITVEYDSSSSSY